jgi:hypothetical protein
MLGMLVMTNVLLVSNWGVRSLILFLGEAIRFYVASLSPDDDDTLEGGRKSGEDIQFDSSLKDCPMPNIDFP